jgi:hypothetical protein
LRIPLVSGSNLSKSNKTQNQHTTIQIPITLTPAQKKKGIENERKTATNRDKLDKLATQ